VGAGWQGPPDPPRIRFLRFNRGRALLRIGAHVWWAILAGWEIIVFPWKIPAAFIKCARGGFGTTPQVESTEKNTLIFD
jgi:hypothetical protein